MNLHEQMLADIDRVFLNLDEFACVHVFNGKKITCIVDDSLGMVPGRKAGDFANQSAIGLLQCDRVVRCNVADMMPQPLPGEKIIMDDREWCVAESGVVESEGMLTLPLNRAF